MKNNRLAYPYVGWIALFVILPLVLIVVYAFTARSGGFTLENFSNMEIYLPVFFRSFWLAFIATAICLAIGYPVAYFLSREGHGFRRIATILIMLPMWMNFLLRTYSWMSILENTGLINTFLQNIGFFTLFNGIFGTSYAYFPMINTQGAIVLGMVYNFLPFMILPIYTVIEKIDYRVIEAAQDLGADTKNVFKRVILPLSLPGILSGITMVFVPSVSTFAISKLLGGGMVTLLGDLIEMQFTGGSYNPYLGSAVSLVMMVIVLICMAVMNRFGEGEEGAVAL
ncbi:ABC transporter permease [Bengtsoniella intestinalis]|uniref:ABC transporter permease n=1 Tax=Bengtsoniella intestinalis TaxID=3073143 RepID=UPI00391F28D4